MSMLDQATSRRLVEKLNTPRGIDWSAFSGWDRPVLLCSCGHVVTSHYVLCRVPSGGTEKRLERPCPNCGKFEGQFVRVKDN